MVSGKKIAERQQIAALPWRPGSPIQILLISSRETKRWIIPKGWPMKDLSFAQAAEREAFEEAGALGLIEQQPAGQYRYVKRMRSGKLQPCIVDVFALRVERLAQNWPEKAERETRWCSPEEAASLVDEPDLANLIRNFALSCQTTLNAGQSHG